MGLVGHVHTLASTPAWQEVIGEFLSREVTRCDFCFGSIALAAALRMKLQEGSILVTSRLLERPRRELADVWIASGGGDRVRSKHTVKGEPTELAGGSDVLCVKRKPRVAPFS